MVIGDVKQRIAILMDAQNMYHSAKSLYGARLDFSRLVGMLSANRNLVRAIVYTSFSQSAPGMKFLHALSAGGLEVKRKRVQEFTNGKRKSDWDVGITIDAIELIESVDGICLVSGDGDFVPLVEHLKKRGLFVEVVGFGASISRELRRAANGYLNISVYADELLLPLRLE